MPQVQVVGSYGEVAAAEWDALVADGSPFLEHAYLFGLEQTGCATTDTGWTPRPVLARDDDGRLMAAAPAWIKTHSMGEFVYDHGWADAARRAGFPYFPKLVVAVPFTPVTGDRLLVRQGVDPEPWRDALLAGLQAAVEQAGCHGLHVLFDTEDESRHLEQRSGFSRLQYQFHWTNEGYHTFDDWLARFRSKARKQIRRERREHAGLTFRVHTNPTPDELDVMHSFYADTCRQFGPWGRVYLSRELFRQLGEVWGHRLVVVLACDGDRVIAGALNVVKGDRLYGRYWGCSEQRPFLHFEVCYYQTVQWCIEQGLAAFEPGHGGGHKYKRGYHPTVTRSNHWLVDPRLHEGLRRHTERERAHVLEEAEALREASTFR